MKNLKALRIDLVQKCLWMYGNTTNRNYFKTVLSDGTLAMILFRLSAFFYEYMLFSFIGWFLSRLNLMLNGIVIGKGASIGDGFIIMHSVGVVINGAAVIGENCILQNSVVIGAVNRNSPVIGDSVHFGAGSKVIGGVIVGSNVQIGANAVVVKNVESDCTVVGVPAKVVKKRCL